MESEGQAEKPGTPAGATPEQDEHEGATEDQIGDRGGPAVGYDQGAKQKNRDTRR